MYAIGNSSNYALRADKQRELNLDRRWAQVRKEGSDNHSLVIAAENSSNHEHFAMRANGNS